MKEYKSVKFTEERALFGVRDAKVTECVFANGESPLKECGNLEINASLFKWKYPLWYCDGVTVNNSTFYEGARAGMWYTKNIEFKDTIIEAPKSFRRSSRIELENVSMPKASETLWNCHGVVMKNVTAAGDYFAMNSTDMTVDGLILNGNYSFDGVKNVIIKNSKLLTKDAFWNSENMTVYDSFVSGEYLGWNSKNLTLVNCTIESLQGMCYIENLKLVNCKLIDTTLAFEYSSVDAEISSEVDSVFNPSSGTIKAKRIGNLIIERDRVDPNKTKIVCSDIGKTSDKIDWSEV